MPHEVGSMIAGRFEVRQILTGGMGEIYACLDTGMDQPVALKTFRHEFLANSEFLKRFEQEIASWILLGRHPNVVQCLTVVTSNSVPYMVLELISGTPEHGHNLRDWLRRGPLAADLALGIAIDICRALEHAVEVHPGFVHCDLKPENILIEEGPNALVTDFGIAHLSRLLPAVTESDRNSGGLLSTSGFSDAAGTPPYMAPEQWLGKSLDPRADIYAIGCMLLEMMSGRPPFAATTVEGLRQQHLVASPPSIDGLPERLRQLIARCLEKSPEARPANVTSLIADLQSCYREIEGREPKPLATPPPRRAIDHSIVGCALTIIGRHHEALAEFDRALALDDTIAAIRTDRGRLLMLMGRQTEALADLNLALKLDPENGLGLFYKAVVIADAGKRAEAIDLVSRAIAAWDGKPGIAEFYHNRSIFYRDLGDRKAALADLRKAIELDPNLSETHHALAVLHIEDENFSAALRELNKSIELNPRNAKALIARGGVKDELKQYTAARKDYELATRIDPTVIPLRQIAAVSSIAPWQERLTELDKSTVVDATADDLIEKGTLLGKSGRLGEALAVFDRAVLRFPENHIVRASRGRVYAELGAIKEAIADYKKSIELSADSFASYNLGNLYLRAGRYLEAMPLFDQAILHAPNEGNIRSNRGTCLLKLGRVTEAERDFRRAIELSPLTPQPHNFLGIIEAQRGRIPQARKHFQRAAKLGSSDAIVALRQLR